MTNFEKLKSNLTATWLSRSWNYRPNAIWINQFGLKIRKLRALENWKRPQTREVVRDGNPADQEVVRDGNMPTKRSYESKVCRPRGRTNRKFADQKVVRIGKPANLDLDLEQKRSGESGILTTWRLCEPEILTTWRSCKSGISLDLEVVRVGDFTRPGGRTNHWRTAERS